MAQPPSPATAPNGRARRGNAAGFASPGGRRCDVVSRSGTRRRGLAQRMPLRQCRRTVLTERPSPLRRFRVLSPTRFLWPCSPAPSRSGGWKLPRRMRSGRGAGRCRLGGGSRRRLASRIPQGVSAHAERGTVGTVPDKRDRWVHFFTEGRPDLLLTLPLPV
jgi:hypothetical protein